MAVVFEKIIKEDLERGVGTVVVTAPAGGTMVGTKIGLHTFAGLVSVYDVNTIQEAITEAGTTLGVLIPPDYTGSDTFTNANERIVVDLRSKIFSLGLKGFVGATTRNRWAVNPHGFAAAASSFNTMMELGMPSSMSGGGTKDVLIYLNVGLSGTALDSTRQRYGIAGTLNAAGTDKATFLNIELRGNTDGIFVGLYGASPGQGINAIVSDSATGALNAIIAEGFPAASMLGNQGLIHIVQHPATTAPSVKAAFSGIALTIEDDAHSVILEDGLTYTEGSAGTSSIAAFISKAGGANLWLRRKADGTALFADDGSGNHFFDLSLTAGEPLVILTGITAGAATFRIAPIAGQQARIQLYDGGTAKYVVGKDASNNFFVFDSANSRNAIQIVSGDVFLNNTAGACNIRNLNVTAGVNSNGSGFKHARTTTGAINGGVRGDVTINWGSAFADTSYTASCVVVETSASGTGLRVERIRTQNAANMVVQVMNDSGGALTGTLHCTGVHD